MTTILIIEANAQSALVSDMTIECVALQPLQGQIRQLSIDRWNYMYPS
jgi:hypothetical protein